MKLNTFTRTLAGSALVAATLGMTLSAHAKTLPFGVGFVTVQDLDITQANALTFGQNVIGTAGSTCTLGVTIYPGATIAASAATAAINDNISGAGCIAVAGALTNNLAGVYEISGAVSQAFNVTVNSATNADFSFSPTARVGDLATGLTAGGTTVFANTPQASVTDAAGLALLVVAGTITVGATDLTPNTPYSQTFDITATY